MNDLDALPEFTADQLVARARAGGLAASPRLVRAWTELGLLAEPLVRNLEGRRGRQPGVRSRHQADLFMTLLRARQRQPEVSNAALANVPVWLWLFYGDDHVPTRQAERALRTWAAQARRPAWERALDAARSIVRRLAHPRARRAGRGRFRDAVARAQMGEAVSRESIAVEVRDALDPDHTGLPRGPLGAELTPQRFAFHGHAATLGADAAASGELSDERLEAARVEYRRTRILYEEERGEFARDPELGHMHEEPTLEDLVNSACKDVVLLIGTQLEAADWRSRKPTRSSP